MDLHLIDPELRPRYRMFPTLPYHRLSWRPALRALLRALGHSRPVSGVSVETHPAGAAQVRLYRPEKGATGAGLLWLHGGGYIVGGASQDDRRCSLFACEQGLIVVSVDYRLAPEHPFPAALTDAHAGWGWLQAHAAELSLDPRRVVLAGESAGGGLAACLAQRLYDEGGVQPAAQLLFYPMLDDCTAARPDLDAVNHPAWNNRSNRAGWSAYLGQSAGEAMTPAYAVAARRVDLSGLPPAWIGVGELDLFYDENRCYAEGLQEAGVSCELVVVPGAPHAFPVVAPDASASQAFLAHAYRYLHQTLHLST